MKELFDNFKKKAKTFLKKLFLGPSLRDDLRFKVGLTKPEEKKSTHKVEIVSVKLEPHPNADTLSIVRVFDGYTVVVKTSEWQGVNKAAYVQPDMVVPNNEQFAFLGGKTRIGAKRLRGIWSQGLLVPAPENSRIGDDVSDLLGIVRYEPVDDPKIRTAGAKPPKGVFPIYDVENWYKFHSKLFEPGEEVAVHCKINGANGRFIFQNDKMHVGTHRTWKDFDKDCLWWRALSQNLWIEIFCKLFPEYALYGEVFGDKVPNGNREMNYDARPGQYFVRIFDIWDVRQCRWLDLNEVGEVRKRFRILADGTDLIWVPLLFVGRHNEKTIREYAEGISAIANHIREGCVVRGIVERNDLRYGRNCLKIVGNGYLAEKKR